MIKLNDAHLKAAIAAEDHSHDGALTQLKSRCKFPAASYGWYRKVNREFALAERHSGCDHANLSRCVSDVIVVRRHVGNET